MHPQIQVVHRQVRPDVAHLLLARTPDFLHIVKILFDGHAIGERFENLLDAGIRVGAKEGAPTMLFLDEHHAEDAAHGRIGRQKGFVSLRGRFAIAKLLQGAVLTFQGNVRY